MNILLLEDDPLLGKLVVEFFTEKGDAVEHCLSGKAALTAIGSAPYDIYLLDVNVPDFNGFACLEAIRRDQPEPIVFMISGDHDIKNIAHAFEMGTNDFVKKPFDLEEIDIRIRWLSRHTQPRPIVPDGPVRLSRECLFDTTARIIDCNGKRIKLTKNEYDVLLLLIQRRGELVTQEEIRRSVWKEKEITMIGVRSVISRLRKKLCGDWIETLKGFGYILKPLPLS